MLVPIFPDQQLYSTCWPGVSTVPHKMSICTLAFLWIRLPWTKRKSLLYNSEIYWEWNTPTPGVPPVQAKQSVCEAEAIDSSCLQESKRNDFPLCKKKKTKWTPPCPWNLRLTVLGFSSRSRHLCTSMMEQLSRKFCDMLQPLWHKYSTLHTASF